MLQIVEQRPDIQAFIDFVGNFLILNEATVDEADLVLANAEILVKRIKDLKGSTKIGVVPNQAAKG